MGWACGLTSARFTHKNQLVLHELGVLHYLNGEHRQAVGFFLQVAQNCQEYDECAREPSIFNLGHAYRKMRDFDNA